MTGLRARSLAALVLIVSLAACKKEGVPGDSVDLPADMRPHPAQGDPSKLVMPPVMAYVPADTPYLIASVDAVPQAFLDRMRQLMQPMFRLMADKWRKQLADPRADHKLMDAVLAEFDGKWSEAGFESLGLTMQARFAIYGLGLQPMVMRVPVKDDKAVRATIERIAARAGETLPPMASKDGRDYWQHDSDGIKIVLALADNQLIASVGSTAEVDAKLGQILGIVKPAQSMADGALVKQLLARDGIGGQLIAFADTRKFAGKALEAAGMPPSPACNSELDRIATAVPRLVIGYGELSGSKISSRTTFELAPDAVAALRGIRSEIPGLGAALAGDPMVAFAGAADLAKAQQLAVSVAGSLKQLGAACGIGPLADGADRAARSLGKPLPDGVGQIAGVAMVLGELSFPGGGPAGMPDKVEGFALVSSTDAHGLFDKAIAQDPQLKSLGIAVDGKLHGVNIPMPLPFAVSAGVGDRLIVGTAGDKSRTTVEKLLGTRGGGKAPLLAFSYDFGKLMGLGMQSMQAALARNPGASDPDTLALISGMQGMLGRVSGVLDVDDAGLSLWGTVDVK